MDSRNHDTQHDFTSSNTADSRLKFDAYEADDREVQTEDVIGAVERAQSLAGTSTEQAAGDILNNTSSPEMRLSSATIAQEAPASTTNHNPTIGIGQGLSTLLGGNTHSPLAANIQPTITVTGDVTAGLVAPYNGNDNVNIMGATTNSTASEISLTSSINNITRINTPSSTGGNVSPNGGNGGSSGGGGSNNGGNGGGGNGDDCNPPSPADCGCGNNSLDAIIDATLDIALTPLPTLLNEAILTLDHAVLPALDLAITPCELQLDASLIHTLTGNIAGTAFISTALNTIAHASIPLSLHGLVHNGLHASLSADIRVNALLEAAHTQTLSVASSVTASLEACISETIGAHVSGAFTAVGTAASALGLDATAQGIATLDATAQAALCLAIDGVASTETLVEASLTLATDTTASFTTSLDVETAFSLQNGLMLDANTASEIIATIDTTIATTTSLASETTATIEASLNAAIEATATTAFEFLSEDEVGLAISSVTDAASSLGFEWSISASDSGLYADDLMGASWIDVSAIDTGSSNLPANDNTLLDTMNPPIDTSSLTHNISALGLGLHSGLGW